MIGQLVLLHIAIKDKSTGVKLEVENLGLPDQSRVSTHVDCLCGGYILFVLPPSSYPFSEICCLLGPVARNLLNLLRNTSEIYHQR
jgi:hypothetical protein